MKDKYDIREKRLNGTRCFSQPEKKKVFVFFLKYPLLRNSGIVSPVSAKQAGNRIIIADSFIIYQPSCPFSHLHIRVFH